MLKPKTQLTEEEKQALYNAHTYKYGHYEVIKQIPHKRTYATPTPRHIGQCKTYNMPTLTEQNNKKIIETLITHITQHNEEKKKMMEVHYDKIKTKSKQGQIKLERATTCTHFTTTERKHQPQPKRQL